MNAVPGVLRCPKEHRSISSNAVVKLWRNLYESGMSQNPPVAAGTATAFFYLAWCVRSGAPLFRRAAYNRTGLYTMAAFLTVGIVLYTILSMRTTNNALLKLAETSKELASDDEAFSHDLINRGSS